MYPCCRDEKRISVSRIWDRWRSVYSAPVVKIVYIHTKTVVWMHSILTPNSLYIKHLSEGQLRVHQGSRLSEATQRPQRLLCRCTQCLPLVHLTNERPWKWSCDRCWPIREIGQWNNFFFNYTQIGYYYFIFKCTLRISDRNGVGTYTVEMWFARIL